MARNRPQTTGVGELRNSLAVSATLHLAALLLLYFGLPKLFKPLPPISRPIPFEIVDIAAITNTRIKDQMEEPDKQAAPPPKPTPQVKAEVKPPEPPQQQQEKQPAPPVPDKPSEALIPKEKPKPPPKPPEPPKPKPQQTDQLSSVLKNVAKLKPTPQKTEQTEENDNKTHEESSQKSMAPSLSDRLTISEDDLLRRQISQCWNMPVGARNAEDLIVEVLIEVNQDRTVRSAEVVDTMRMASDPFFRAAAESALRALRHPRCSPLELPPDKYEQWKTIRFNFDPRDML